MYEICVILLTIAIFLIAVVTKLPCFSLFISSFVLVLAHHAYFVEIIEITLFKMSLYLKPIHLFY